MCSVLHFANLEFIQIKGEQNNKDACNSNKNNKPRQLFDYCRLYF